MCKNIIIILYVTGFVTTIFICKIISTLKYVIEILILLYDTGLMQRRNRE